MSCGGFRSVCFNPRPDRAAGATVDPAGAADRVPVSIRAPTVRPGRQHCLVAILTLIVFQSAPRPCGRGDPGRRERRTSPRRFNPRPDRAAGATRRPHSLLPAPSSFNPRPDRAAGATKIQLGSLALGVVSIRAPTVRPGRLGLFAGRVMIRQVSIRAPTVRPGRPQRAASRSALATFQSAPRPCGRGDT